MEKVREMEEKHKTNIAKSLKVNIIFRGLEKLKKISAGDKPRIKVTCTKRTSAEVDVLES